MHIASFFLMKWPDFESEIKLKQNKYSLNLARAHIWRNIFG